MRKGEPFSAKIENNVSRLLVFLQHHNSEILFLGYSQCNGNFSYIDQSASLFGALLRWKQIRPSAIQRFLLNDTYEQDRNAT